MGAALGPAGEAFVDQEFGSIDDGAERLPEPVVAHHQELQPAIVLGAVEIGKRVARLVGSEARRQLSADQRAGGGGAIGPNAVGVERGADPAAFAGLITTAEPHQDRGDESHRRGAIALRRQRDAGRAVFVARCIEDAGAAEIGGDVEAWPVAVRAGLAVAGERAIDEARVQRLDILPAQF